jgi:general secretion pathway protein D
MPAVRRYPTLAALAALAALALAPPASAGEEPGEKEPKSGQGEEALPVDLTNRTLGDLFELVQTHTGILFLAPPQIQATKIYAAGVRTLTRGQLLQVFQAVLELQGFALVPVVVWPGVILTKVVPAPQGRFYPGPTFGKDEIHADPALLEGRQDMVTVIYPLRYAQAANVQQSLFPLISQNPSGTIMGIPNVEVLILTDFAPNVLRMFQIMDLMDVPGPPQVLDVLALRHAVVDDILPLLRQLNQLMVEYQARRSQGQGGAEETVNLLPDERTNAVILQGSPALVSRMRDLVEQLDIPLDTERSRIHILRLRHKDAEEMAQTVNTLLQSVSLRQLAGALPGGGSGGAPGSPEGAPVPPGPPPPASAARGSAAAERTAAIPDKAANALILVAGEAEFEVVRRLVESLDVRRPQVLVEVEILEVSEGEGYSLGLELTTLDGSREDSTRGFASTRFGTSNLVDRDGTPLTGPGLPGGQFPTVSQGAVIGLHRGKEWRIPALLHLLGSESSVNVMSLPRVVTNDNETAELKVVDKVPTATSSAAGTTAVQTGFGGFQEAGITLKILPHISEGDYLRLEIEQKISQFTGTSQVINSGGNAVGVLPPGKTERELKNVITVPDGKTVILGGLTSRTRQTTVSKVPLLGDIPLLGELFRHTSSDWRRTNLYIFITPHILRERSLEDYGRLSGAHTARAEAAGAELGESDRHWREAFREEREMAGRPGGRTHSVTDYVRPARGER